MATKISYETSRYSDICGSIEDRTIMGICSELPKEVLEVLGDYYRLSDRNMESLKISRVKLTPKNIFSELGLQEGDDSFLEEICGSKETLIEKVNKISIYDLIPIIDRSGRFESRRRKDKK